MKKIITLCFAIMAMSSTYSQVVTNGLIGYWPLDGNADDTAGVNNWHGTVIGATLTADRTGDPSTAYEFAGVSRIEIPGVTRSTKSMAVSIWVYPTSSDTPHGSWVINQRSNPSNDQFQITYSDTATYISISYGPTTSDWISVQCDALVFNEWNHIVLQTDGTAGSDVQGYINNVAQTPVTLPSDMNYNMTQEIRVGQMGWSNSAGQLFGKVDEIALFNRSLTAAEVDLIYNHDNDQGGSGTDGLWTDNGTNIYRVGKVAVNTETLPAGFEFAVDGKIVTKEVKVTLSGWADFVFEKDYQLPTLKEVEKHIKEKGHLPSIPSAKEVEKDGGFSLGEMNKILLQKIEELTLYTIKQEKEIKELKSLLKRVEDLEKALQKK